MPHGAPDWYKYRRDSRTFPIDDLAELAARLWSPHTFDRRGDILWMDDFHHGLGGWQPSVLNSGASVAISPDYFLSGGYSARLTGGSSAAGVAYIFTHLAYPVLSRIGLEVAISCDGNMDELYFHLRLYDGAFYDWAAARVDFTNNRLRRMDDGGGWEDVATGLRLEQDVFHFNFLKLVVDFVHNTYERLIWNNTTYDLRPNPIFTTGSGLGPYLFVEILVDPTTGTNAVAYVDRVIITQDEP